jgi:digeranylgeranylglycerophospholipid reductase
VVHDVIVIGAGPAGSVAAERIARDGRSVVVLEEHAEVGQPVHCTGLLGEEALAEFDLPRSLVLEVAGEARFYGRAGQSFTVASDRVRAAIIDRAALDRTLAERAVQAGAELRRGWRASGIAVGAGGVTVTGPGAEVRARACILACGANYRFHRALGLGRPDAFLQSAQLEVSFPRLPGIEVQFGRDVAPSGFAWIVPFARDGIPQARIGLMTESKARERFAAFLRRSYERAGYGEAEVAEPRLKMLPLGPVTRTYADRVLAVGDAAGLVKPTTGGGIYYGMLSGVLAADVLVKGLRHDRVDAGALREYEVRWRQSLGPEIEMGTTFRRIAQGLSDDSIDALIALGKANGVVPILQRTASFNWHRKAAAALLGHPSFRRVVFKTLARRAEPD